MISKKYQIKCTSKWDTCLWENFVLYMQNWAETLCWVLGCNSPFCAILPTQHHPRKNDGSLYFQLQAQSGHRKRKRTKQSKNTVRSPRSSTGAVVASVTASCHQMQTRAHKMHGEQPLHNDTCLVPLTRITLSVLDPIIPKEFQTFSESEHEPMLPGFSLAQTVRTFILTPSVVFILLHTLKHANGIEKCICAPSWVKSALTCTEPW